MRASRDFTTGKIVRPLLSFAFPVFLAMFLQSLYGAVDLLVVGHYGKAANVSAVSVGTMVMQTLTFVIGNIAMGATILIARKIGERKEEEVASLIGAELCFFLLITLLTTLFVVPLAGKIALVLRAPAEALDGTVAYIRICSLASVCVVAYNLIGSIFRGLGNSTMPLISVLIACVCNIAGDLYFVGSLGLGERGAALATVLSQGLSVVISLVIMKRGKLGLRVRRADIRFDGKVMASTIRLGFPIALQELLVSISFLVVASIVNTLGVVASAGVGIAEKVCGFIMLVPSSFMQSMAAFTAQNCAAGKTQRAKKALWACVLISLLVGLAVFHLAFFHGDLLSSVFSPDAVLVSAARDYLKAYAWDCVFVSFLFSMVGFFNGMGRTRFVMVQGIIGAFCVRVPVSLLMSRITPVSLFHIGLATPSSTVAQILLCFLYYRSVMRGGRTAHTDSGV